MTTRFAPLIKKLENAMREQGREDTIIRRTLDLYTVVPEGFPPEVPNMENPLAGSDESIAERILGLEELGTSEVRCDVFPRTIEAIEAMAPIVSRSFSPESATTASWPRPGQSAMPHGA